MQSSIIAKLLTLLTIISETRKPLTFSELVSKSGMNKSTIHRLLAIGVEEGVVQFDTQRKTYLLGAKVFDLVRNAHSGYDIQAIALDEMLRLHGVLDVNVTIGVPSGTEVVYLRCLDANAPSGATQRPGMREPVHSSASGKVLMAFTPDSIVRAKMDGYPFERFTDRTITDAAGFYTALEIVRKQGFATNDREEYDHFLGISAPVFNYLGEPIAVLNLWSTHPRHVLADVHSWADELMTSTARVTGLIGGVAPDPATLTS